MNKNKTPDLRLRKRQGRVASEDNNNHPRFLFSKATPFQTKRNELLPVSAKRLQMHVKQYSSLGQAIFDRLGNRCRKDPDTMFTRKKDPDPKPPFSKDPLSGSVFEKLRFGARAFSKSSGYVRIRVAVSMYPGSKSSVFQKTRVRVHVIPWSWNLAHFLSVVFSPISW